MARKKTKSHRQSLRTKHMISKKAQAQRKKSSKLARLNPLALNKSKKDPGVPNLFPFKEQLLRSATKQHEDMKDIKEHSKKLRESAVQSRAQLLVNAEKRINSFNTAAQQQNDSTSLGGRRWYFKELNKVVETADVILEVLDARDPMGCRCLQLEERIVGELSARSPRSKRVVLVLNKIDLIPREIAEGWLLYLRQFFPTVAFKASTQTQKGNLSFGSGKAETASDDMISKSGSLGADALLQLLKNYSRSLNMHTAINVGVIGYPNVGKSSIINSLKRCRAVSTGSTPGLTKHIQEVHLDSKIKLLDSPGVLFSDDERAVLRNAVKVESIEDPASIVETLLARFPPQELMEIYEIAAFQSVSEFLMRVAHKRGKLKRGGVPDLDATARVVLRDWNDGRIPFFTRAPLVESRTVCNTQIVSESDAAQQQMPIDDIALAGAGAMMSDDTVFVPLKPEPMMEVDEEVMFETIPGGESAPVSVAPARATHNEPEDALNPRTNRSMRLADKRRKKKERKTTQAMQQDEEEALSDDEDYDFNQEF